MQRGAGLSSPPSVPPRCAAALQVYVLSRGAVKPANKRYATVRNDYTLHFDNGADIEAAEGGRP